MRVAFFAVLILSACVPKGDGRVKNLLPKSSCGAENLQHLVNLPYEARDFEVEGRALRILPPGSVMTMDHRIDRLNVDLDQKGIITRIWCG